MIKLKFSQNNKFNRSRYRLNNIKNKKKYYGIQFRLKRKTNLKFINFKVKNQGEYKEKY